MHILILHNEGKTNFFTSGTVEKVGLQTPDVTDSQADDDIPLIHRLDVLRGEKMPVKRKPVIQGQ